VVRVKGKALPVAIYLPLGNKSGLTEARQQEATEFEAAFGRYQAQDWEGAESALRSLNSRTPRALYDIYLERIADFRVEPPAADWDGVWVYTTK
jgi:adenylate cyclase